MSIKKYLKEMLRELKEVKEILEELVPEANHEWREFFKKLKSA